MKGAVLSSLLTHTHPLFCTHSLSLYVSLSLSLTHTHTRMMLCRWMKGVVLSSLLILMGGSSKVPFLIQQVRSKRYVNSNSHTHSHTLIYVHINEYIATYLHIYAYMNIYVYVCVQLIQILGCNNGGGGWIFFKSKAVSSKVRSNMQTFFSTFSCCLPYTCGILETQELFAQNLFYP